MNKILGKIILLTMIIAFIFSANTFAAEDNNAVKMDFTITNDNIFEIIEKYSDKTTPKFYNSNRPVISTELREYIASECYKANIDIDISSYNLKVATYDDMIDVSSEIFSFEELYGFSSLTWSYIPGTEENPGFQITNLKFTYTRTAEEFKNGQEIINGVVNDFIAGSNPSWNDLEKAIYTHNYIAQKCKYAEPILETSHDIYAALVVGRPVCDGYSKTFEFLGKKIGLDSTLATSDEMRHAWNLVKINGNYYNMDLTWDDSANSNGKISYKYFLNSDTEFTTNKEHYSWVSDVTATDLKFDTNTIWEKSTNYITLLDGYWYILDNLVSNNNNIVVNQYNLNDIDSFVKESKTYTADVQSFDPALTTDGTYLYTTTNKNIYRFKFDNEELERLYSITEEGTLLYSLNYYNNNFTYDTFSWSDSDYTENTFVLATGIAIDKQSSKLLVGDEVQLAATISPNEATSKEIIWKSSDSSIATVDQTGKVTAVSIGKVEISASTLFGQEAKVTCYVLNEDDYNIKSIELSDSTINLNKEETKNITGNYIKNDDSSVAGTFTWETSDSSIATVDENGKITAVGSGKCTITAKYLDFTDTVSVTVNYDITGMNFNLESFELAKSKTKQLNVIFTPSENIDKSLVWTSDDESIAKVDENGLVTAVEAGTTNIHAESINGIKIDCEVTVIIPVSEIKFNNEIISMKPEKTYQIVATILPENASNKTLTWSSSDEKVATVDSNGLVTSVGVGSCKIYATSSDGATSNFVAIGVNKPATSIKFDKTSIKIDKTNTATLSVVYNEYEIHENITSWVSSNPEIATVDENGLVTGVEYGSTTITATTENNLSATCSVEVTKMPTSISFTESTHAMIPQQVHTLTTVFEPSDDNINKSLTWESSNTDVATVDSNGKITAITKGNTVITATTLNGLQASCDVTVMIVVRSVSINPSTATLNRGETIQLDATAAPSDADDTSLVWSSDNPELATVDQNGLVTAVEAGVATIKAESVNGKIGRATINIRLSADSVLINNGDEKVSISVNQRNYQLTPSLTPANSTSSVTWESSNEDIVVVSQFGEITAVAPGEATITVTTDNGKTDTILVRVYQIVSGIDLNTRNVKLETGVTYPLQYTLSPTGVENLIVWKSDDESVATVDSNGLITAVSEGDATIYAIAENGVQNTCTVSVSNLIDYTTYTNYRESYGNVIVVPAGKKYEEILNEEIFPCLGDDYTVEFLNKNDEPLKNTAYVPSFGKVVIKDTLGVTMKKYEVAVKGDISGNGQVKLYDAFTILRKVLKNTEFVGVENIIGDFSGNKQVKLYDAFQFLRLALKS